MPALPAQTSRCLCPPNGPDGTSDPRVVCALQCGHETTGSALPRGAPFARRRRGTRCVSGRLAASELLEDLDRALKDRLDSGKFLTVGVGLAGAGRLSPSRSSARARSMLPRSAGDGDDLDGPALVFERVRARGAPLPRNRGRGVVAGTT